MKREDLIPGYHVIGVTSSVHPDEEYLYLVAKTDSGDLWGVDIGLSDGLYTSCFRFPDEKQETHVLVKRVYTVRYASGSGSHHLKSHLNLVWAADQPKKMTKEEIESELGYSVEIVSDKA